MSTVNYHNISYNHILTLVVSSLLFLSVSFPHFLIFDSTHLFVYLLVSITFTNPVLRLTPLFSPNVHRSSTWWSLTVTHGSSSPPFTKSACVLRLMADRYRTPTKSLAVPHPQNTAPALTALHFLPQKRCKLLLFDSTKGTFHGHCCTAQYSRFNLFFLFCNQQEARKQRSGRSLNEDSRDESADKKRGIFFSWSRNRSFGKGPKKKDIGDINLGEKWLNKPVGFWLPRKSLQHTNFQSADVCLNKAPNRCQLQSCHELHVGEACRNTAGPQRSKYYTRYWHTGKNILVATLAHCQSIIHKEPVF